MRKSDRDSDDREDHAYVVAECLLYDKDRTVCMFELKNCSKVVTTVLLERRQPGGGSTSSGR